MKDDVSIVSIITLFLATVIILCLLFYEVQTAKKESLSYQKQHAAIRQEAIKEWNEKQKQKNM